MGREAFRERYKTRLQQFHLETDREKKLKRQRDALMEILEDLIRELGKIERKDPEPLIKKLKEKIDET